MEHDSGICAAKATTAVEAMAMDGASRLLLFRTLDHVATEHRFRRQPVLDIGAAAHAAVRAAPGKHFHLQAQLVARHDRAAKARLIDAGEEDQMPRRILDLE